MLFVNSFYLIFLLIIILLFINYFILKKNNIINSLSKILISSFIILGASIMYYYSGNLVEINKLNQMKDSQKLVLSLISKLENTVSNNPDDAKGWYLLGKMYIKINQEKKALEVFQKAHFLDKDNVNYAIQYYWVKFALHNSLNQNDINYLKSLVNKNLKEEEHKKLEKLVTMNLL